MKKAAMIIILIALSVSVCVPAFAHSSSLTSTFDKTTRDGITYIGKESMGWLLNESAHTNGQTVTYRTSAGMGYTVRSKVDGGAGLWSNYSGSPFSISYLSNSSNYVMISSMISGDIVTEISSASTNSSGHFTSWTIAINSHKENKLSSVVMAHEFGHILGLGDLTSSSNNNKLMCDDCNTGDQSGITGPTSSDKWGAKVITGYHWSHSWEYVYTSNGKHHRRCTSCGGFKTQGCTPDANGYCTKCGHYIDNTGNGVLDPTAALLPNTDEERRFMFGILI